LYDFDRISNWLGSRFGPPQPGFVNIFGEESEFKWPSREGGDAQEKVEIRQKR
jgi:hypothetical protein